MSSIVLTLDNIDTLLLYTSQADSSNMATMANKPIFIYTP